MIESTRLVAQESQTFTSFARSIPPRTTFSGEAMAKKTKDLSTLASQFYREIDRVRVPASPPAFSRYRSTHQAANISEWCLLKTAFSFPY